MAITKRKLLVWGSFFAIVLFFLFVVPTKVAWVGSRELDVEVVVVDATRLEPVANATVEVLRGPDSGWQPYPLNIEDDFELIHTKQRTTDKSGRTFFTYSFFAAGTDSIFEKTGYVETREVWLRVSAEGYVTTHLPVDRQSMRSRNIDDDSPLFVTVPIGKSQLTTNH